MSSTYAFDLDPRRPSLSMILAARRNKTTRNIHQTPSRWLTAVNWNFFARFSGHWQVVPFCTIRVAFLGQCTPLRSFRSIDASSLVSGNLTC